jgi:hypothetical protein
MGRRRLWLRPLRQSAPAGRHDERLRGWPLCARHPRDPAGEAQVGLEPTPAQYVAALVETFREVRRVLRDDGTLWLNLGDSYNAYGGAGPGSKLSKTQTEQRPKLATGYGLQVKSMKPKDLIGIPWRVAFALQEDGWYLRSDIIWASRTRCRRA